jgi:TolB-like protein/tetratricopeptide (TPR) repeat protein
MLGAWRAFSAREPQASIAVLPFTNLSADSTNQYFSDGLTDEITDSLARLKTLRVIARSSAFQFKGKAADVREIGRLLNVGSVLEGSVQRSGDRIRVVAQLERVSDGSHVWSNTYEGRTSDLFTMQSELAARVAASLKPNLQIPPAKHIPDPEAHDSVMKARYDLQQLTVDSLRRAEREYQHAIDLDPQYAFAYLGLGSAKYDESVASGSFHQTETARHDAERFLDKALQLDPDLSSARSLLALLALQYAWDWSRAERELQRATSGASTADAEGDFGLLLVFLGRFSQADAHLRRMVDWDPFSIATLNNLALARNLQGRFAEAREVAQKMAAASPKALPPPLMIGFTYVEEGHPELAMPIFRELKQRFPPAAAFEAMACARAGQREQALALIRPFEEKYPNSGVPMQWLALVYAFLGDEPNTVKWLQRSADRHEWQALNLAVHPAYAHMRNSPAFRGLEKRMGLEH